MQRRVCQVLSPAGMLRNCTNLSLVITNALNFPDRSLQRNHRYGLFQPTILTHDTSGTLPCKPQITAEQLFACAAYCSTMPSVFNSGGHINIEEEKRFDPLVPAATTSVDVEPNIEEGDVRETINNVYVDGGARTITSARVSHTAEAAAALARVATVAVVEPALSDQGIVLPCAPSDEEKVRPTCVDISECVAVLIRCCVWCGH